MGRKGCQTRPAHQWVFSMHSTRSKTRPESLELNERLAQTARGLPPSSRTDSNRVTPRLMTPLSNMVEAPRTMRKAGWPCRSKLLLFSKTNPLNISRNPQLTPWVLRPVTPLPKKLCLFPDREQCLCRWPPRDLQQKCSVENEKDRLDPDDLFLQGLDS